MTDESEGFGFDFDKWIDLCIIENEECGFHGRAMPYKLVQSELARLRKIERVARVVSGWLECEDGDCGCHESELRAALAKGGECNHDPADFIHGRCRSCEALSALAKGGE